MIKIKCPHCESEIAFTVCPECGKPVRMRTGLRGYNILVEIPYAVGRKFARYYAIGYLKPNGSQPLKLAWGCLEKPLSYLRGKIEYFNPVLIKPEQLALLREINNMQLAAETAFRSLVKRSPVTLSLSQVYSSILNCRGKIAGEARKLRILMEEKELKV